MILALLLASLLPNATLTPGAIRPLTHATICATRWELDRRHVTLAMRRTVLTSYGIAWGERGAFELDHLIPRELGGADVIPNLWPQPIAEARRKDRLENRLHALVCRGSLTLARAQRLIAGDWARTAHRFLPQ